MLTNYDPHAKHITVPYGTTEIAPNEFHGLKELETVTLPNTVL